MALCVAFATGAQSQYNPDVDGDGCITVTDVLGVLSLFDTCAEGTTLYYFHDDPSKHPMGAQLNVEAFGTQTWWLTDEVNQWYESSDFAEFIGWTIDHQGEVLVDFEVMPVDSVLGVSTPLSESILNGSIDMPPTTSGGRYFIIVNQQLDFDFTGTPVFNHPGGCGASPVILHEFEWQGENWSLLQLTNYLPSTAGYVFNVPCGY